MISIIIPVYNVEKYLDACVESVRKLRTDFEALLIDDGSTDGSGCLCDAWAEKDSRIRVIHQENGGLSAARNTGIRNARGSHTLFLDSDDFLDPEQTDAMLAQLTEETDVLLGLYNCYYEQEERYEKENCEGFLSLSGTVPMERFLQAVPVDGGSCFMVSVRFVCRREFLLAQDLLFFPGIYHEDEDWTARLLCAANRITVTDRYFYQYRQARAGAITQGMKPKRIFDQFTIIGRLDGLRRSQAAGSVAAAYLQSRMAMMYLSNLIWQHSLRGEDRKRGLEGLRKYRRLCAGSMEGRIGKAAGLSVRLLGLRITGGLLGAAKKLTGG